MKKTFIYSGTYFNITKKEWIMRKNSLVFGLLFLFFGILFMASLGFVSAWNFTGYTYDTEGNPLNNTIINITLWTGGMGGPPSLVGYNASYSNESGWFNFSITENNDWMYKPLIRHFAENKTDGSTEIDYIGQSLPQFPCSEFCGLSNIDFYLREAGTINLSAVNITGNQKNFQYVVKDTKLGYPIEEGFGVSVPFATVYVLRDRNYTIQIYPEESMPVSYHWNNFSSDSDYVIEAGLSDYNETTHVLNKTFNCSESLVWVNGYALNSSGGIDDYDEFNVIPFLLEAGNMIYLGEDVSMPYNMSAWRMSRVIQENESNAYINETGYQLLKGGSQYTITAIWAEEEGEYNVSVPLENAFVDDSGLVTNNTATTYPNVSISYEYTDRSYSDQYTLNSGFYNITLPGTAESVEYILFATARNGTDYYGGYKNISLNYGDGDSNWINFTMYPLMSHDSWASSTSNITMNDASSWNNVNISSARQEFNLVNASNGALLQNINAHIEATVDYSDYGATEFTFMLDISEGDASFYLPLINVSIEEINVYSGNFAPRNLGTKTPEQILSFNNISMAVFNPGDIEESLGESEISIMIHKSNDTCNVPNPPQSCDVKSEQTKENFNPLSAVLGGGKLNFRMKYNKIEIVYINVDMLASGPPDANFDSTADTSTSGGFETAMKFGSNGPTIYDYVLISMPYTQGSSSQTGLNESSDVNMSIPYFYGEDSSGEMDWDNPIWDSSLNGTNGTFLGGNHSHYSEHYSEWEILMSQNNCTRNQSELSAINPCYIDTTNDRIWIRLPHFSGTKPGITGSVVTADSGDDEEDGDDDEEDGSSGGSTTATTTSSFWTSTYVLNENSLKEFEGKGFSKEMTLKQRLRINLNGSEHHVGVVELTEILATINVSSDPQQAIFKVGDEKMFDVNEDDFYDLMIKLNSIESSKANITIKYVYEEVVPEDNFGINANESAEGTAGLNESGTQLQESGDSKISNAKLWISLSLAIIVILLAVYLIFIRKWN
jgi:hypothetical protein